MGKAKKSLNDIIDYINKNNLKNEYVLLSKEYINYSTKLDFYHKTCGNKFQMDYNHFVNRNQRCPHCSKNSKKDHKWFIDQIKKIYKNDIKVLTKYDGYRKKVRVRHKCNKEYYITAGTLLQGYSCPYCSKTKVKTYDEFIKDVYNQVGDEYEVLSKTYINNKTKILFYHKKCGYKFKMRPNDFLSNKNRCPKCSKYITNNSKGALFIENYLINNNYNFKKEYTFDDCKYKNKLRYDFIIFNKNNKPIIAIEYNGKQHYENSFNSKSNFEKQKIRDQIKRDYCKKSNINLIEISYKDSLNEEYLNKCLTTIESISL